MLTGGGIKAGEARVGQQLQLYDSESAKAIPVTVLDVDTFPDSIGLVVEVVDAHQVSPGQVLAS